LAADALDLADALGLPRFAILGHDWGARAAYTAAALAPERISRIAVLSTAWSGLDLGWPSQEQNHAYWYQWLIGTPRGLHVLEHDREAFTRHLWQLWSPGWTVPEAEFRTALDAFRNPDWPAVTAHSYRSRWHLAPLDPAYDAARDRIAADPRIRVPTLLLHGAADPVSLPAGSADQASLFTAGFERVILPGLGHFPHRQDPDAVRAHLLPFLAATA
ncbi:MAG: alpha/beta hydrolase, partial [Gluconacetobacter diazotrophicus]|nr:alpha/beta hydrolase [Gluconacetobacter diazotrophicus]